MAGDWIKMRVNLAKHAKVIWMADMLAIDREFMNWVSHPFRITCNESAYEHVTCYVTRCVTVASLLQVWGIANETGKSDGDDLIVKHLTIEGIDEIAGVPHFGEAMREVGWVIEETHADGSPLLRFPEFMLYNVPIEERKKEDNAQRQKRYRDNKRNETLRNATVTRNANSNAREEKRRIRSILLTEQAKPASVPSPGEATSRDDELPSVKESEPPTETRAQPPVLTFPVVGKSGQTKATEWHLSQSVVDGLAECFPGLDVLGECRKALAWVRAVPSRRKTPSGMEKFLTGWMTRAVNDGRSGAGSRQVQRDPIASTQDWVERQRAREAGL